MKKQELLKELAKRTGLTKKDVEAVYNTLADIQKELLLNGEKVILENFGSLTTKDVAARKGINPKTGAKITISARKVVKFKASSVIKEELNK